MSILREAKAIWLLIPKSNFLLERHILTEVINWGSVSIGSALKS